MLVPTPTVQLEARAKSSSSSSSASSSDYCSDGKHSKSSACQKPVNQNSLEIGLGVGIPVFLIMCVLGYFLFRNYRKDKREGLEHDPDFDEIGEATVLPDFPAFGSEDPFSGNGQKRYAEYPASRKQNPSGNDLSKFSSRNLDEGYDGFVLPYQHQTGSKASLDEYAKQIMAKSSFGKTQLIHSSLNPLQASSRRSSPQKKNTVAMGQHEPAGKLTAEDFTGLANDSTTLVEDEFYNSRDHFGTSKASLVASEGFDVQYENEDDTDIDSGSETDREDRRSVGYENKYVNQADEIESVEDFSDSDDKLGVEGVSPTLDVLSPFEDHHELSTTHSATTRDTSASIGSKSERLPSPLKGLSLRKSPALATLDVLNKSTDAEEDREQGYEREHEQEYESKAEGSEEMTKEQEEQLARMKSVYKVYFDRSNSMKSEAPESSSFQVDESQPLPKLNGPHLMVNENLKADTDYAKRHTAASSVYDAVPIFHEEEQHRGQANNYGYPAQENGHGGEYSASDGGYSNGYGYQHSPYGEADHRQNEPPQPLAPLQSLPHASDFRNSSIETFTNYVPRARLVSTSKYDSESSLSTPVSRHQPTFGSPGDEGIPPALRKTPHESVPSATQLSRTSVVMLNPVSEIGPLRKYKPAGSLPSGSGSPSMTNNQWASSNDDLIPGNRKSAVRRMMNTTF